LPADAILIEPREDGSARRIVRVAVAAPLSGRMKLKVEDVSSRLARDGVDVLDQLWHGRGNYWFERLKPS
jgi:hypothetical protein